MGSASDQQVSLQWASSSDDNEVAGYNVYVNDSYVKTVFEPSYSGALNTDIDNEIYVTSFDVPLAGEQRSYSISSDVAFFAADGSNNAPVPDNDGAPLDTQRPDVPGDLVLRSVERDALSFSWNVALDNVATVGYNIYRNETYYDTVFAVEYTDTAPLLNSTNIYSVVAFDEARNYSSQSDGLSATVTDSPAVPPGDPDTQDPIADDLPDTERPATPMGLSVTLVSQGGESASVFEWQAATDNVAVVGYNVYRDDDYLLTTRDLSFTDFSGGQGSSFTYSVVAFDEARNFSPRSDNVGLTPPISDPIARPEDPDTGLPNDPPANDPGDDQPANDDTGPMVPVLDPSNRFPSPDINDPFGSSLEIDTEVPVPGGPPTTPKNLRIDLVSNNWAEFSWAPANDDEAVVGYRIYRSDGVVYDVSPDVTDIDGGAQAEIDKYWITTSFIDCNFTRFDTRNYNCRANQPVPGETYTYQVSAFDAQGQESVFSAPLSITYHLLENAPVPIFDDFYKMPDDRFAQNNDLSQTRFFLDEFDLVFNDEFDGTSIDPTKWQTELSWQDSVIINGEQQYFVRTQADPDFGYDPFSFDGDNLTISAIPTPDSLVEKLPPVCDEIDPTGNERCQFLSGALSTYDRFGFLYGYVEGRMKAGGTPGMLSSFYLFHRYKGSGVNLHAPEIDILEYLGENPFGDEDAFQTYHFEDVNTEVTRSAPTMSYANPTGELYSDDYHTFGVLWEPQLVIWYIDGREVKRMTGPMVSRQPMNIVNYLVAGSAWAPTPDVSNPDIFPLEYNVDYIRVYQREAYQGTASFGP